MSKFHRSKLSNEEKRDYFIQLCYVLVETRSINEAAELLSDLLTEQETEMVSKRLQIADLLVDGCNYQEIRKALKVSDTTIARVNAWLKAAGDGFRLATKRLEKHKKHNLKKIKNRNDSWHSLKRKYPLYFWPQLLLEEIIKSADRRQKERMRMIMNQMQHKTQLYKNLNKLLK